MKMQDEIRIRDRVISRDEPIFIIAECGITCNYDMDITKQLIDVTVDAGADAIKFIFWFPDEIMSDRSVEWEYETLDGQESENMYEMLDDLRFTLDEWKEVKNYADKKDVIMFATVNSPSGIEYAEELGLEAYKLSSWDYNYHPLWSDIAELGKPMLIDTGPVDNLEVSKVIDLMENAGNDKGLFLHCFHTDRYENMNMRSIPYLQKAFRVLTGYSAPDRNDEMDIVATSLGAVVLEKRLTLDRSLPGHHHIYSKEPDEFKDYVQKMRNVQQSLGEEDLLPSDEDIEERRMAFRHLVADTDIEEGTVLTEGMIEGKRPEKPDVGISPEYIDKVLGHTVNRDIKRNETISWDDIKS